MTRTLAALAILLVLTSAFFWKLTFTADWTFLEGPDLAIQVRPWLDLGAREFHAGRFPVWTAYEWAGHPLLAQVQPGAANPLNWILFAMPLRDGHIPISTLHWYWVLIHWLGAVFAYALCRDIGAGSVPSLLGACVFALAGFMGHTDWPQILMSSIWTPLVLMFFLRVIRGQRPLASGALAGAAMGLSFLGTHHVIPTFTALVVCALWLVRIARRPRDAGPFAIFVMVTGLVAAFQVLPAMEYSRQAIRWAGAPDTILPGERVPFSVHQEYSLKWPELSAIVLPRGATHVNPHAGITACALAVLALVHRRKAAAWWIGGLAAGALFIALAPAPYWFVWRFVPMVEKAREPAFAVAIVQLGIASLAALGLSSLPRWAAPLALALFLGEAFYNAPHFNRFDRPDSYTAMIRGQADAMQFLRGQPGWFRSDFNDADVPYNAGDLYGIEQFGGALSSMLVRTHRVLGSADSPQRYGIAFRVSRGDPRPKETEVFRSGSGLKVFRDPAIREPMWSIPCPDASRFRVVSREPARFVIDAEMACSGLAVVGDAYYPGWRAWVDGQRVPVQEVEGVRGVRASAGRHRIEFRYSPASVYWGAGLSLLGLMLAAIAAMAHQRSPRTQALP